MSDLQYTLGLDAANFGGGIRGALATLGDLSLALDLVKKVASGISFGINIAAQAEKTETAINTILKSTRLTKAVMQELTDFSASTPFEMPGIAVAARQLLGAGTNVSDLRSELQVMGDVAAGADTDLAGLVTVLNQVRGRTKLAADDFQQFTDRGVVGLREELAKVKGIQVSEVADAMTAGKISSDDLYAALKQMTSEGGTFFNAMINQSKTWDGMMSTLTDNAMGLVRVFGTPMLDALKPQLQGAIDALGVATQEAAVFVETLQLAAQSGKLGEFLEISVALGLKKAWLGFSEMMTGAWDAFEDKAYNALYAGFAKGWNATIGKFMGQTFDVPVLPGQGFLEKMNEDVDTLQKRLDAMTQEARLGIQVKKEESRKAMEEAGKAGGNAYNKTVAAGTAAAASTTGGSGGGDEPGRKRIKGFSRKKAGLKDFGGLDEYYALQTGGRGERKFDAFYRGSDKRFDKGKSRQTSAAEAAGLAPKITREGGAAFNSIQQRLLEVPGRVPAPTLPTTPTPATTSGRVQSAVAPAPGATTPGNAGNGAGGAGAGDMGGKLDAILKELQRIRTE